MTRLGEFEERRAHSIGHFITADDIEKAHPAWITDMLRTVLSVGVNDQKRTVGNTRAGCGFQIFLDGVIVSEHGDLNGVPAPRDIAGVEIYSAPATIPLQYKRNGAKCGVILAWTK